MKYTKENIVNVTFKAYSDTYTILDINTYPTLHQHSSSRNIESCMDIIGIIEHINSGIFKIVGETAIQYPIFN